MNRRFSRASRITARRTVRTSRIVLAVTAALFVVCAVWFAIGWSTSGIEFPGSLAVSAIALIAFVALWAMLLFLTQWSAVWIADGALHIERVLGRGQTIALDDITTPLFLSVWLPTRLGSVATTRVAVFHRGSHTAVWPFENNLMLDALDQRVEVRNDSETRSSWAMRRRYPQSFSWIQALVYSAVGMIVLSLIPVALIAWLFLSLQP